MFTKAAGIVSLSLRLGSRFLLNSREFPWAWAPRWNSQLRLCDFFQPHAREQLCSQSPTKGWNLKLRTRSTHRNFTHSTFFSPPFPSLHSQRFTPASPSPSFSPSALHFTIRPTPFHIPHQKLLVIFRALMPHLIFSVRVPAFRASLVLLFHQRANLTFWLLVLPRVIELHQVSNRFTRELKSKGNEFLFANIFKPFHHFPDFLELLRMNFEGLIEEQPVIARPRVVAEGHIVSQISGGLLEIVSVIYQHSWFPQS